MDIKQNLTGILVLGMGLMMISAWSEPVLADSPGPQLYKKACKKCHGKLGLGKKGKAASSEYKYPPIHTLSEEDLLAAMTKYREMWQDKTYDKRAKKMAKPAGRLSDEEMQALADFITSELSPKGE